MAAKLILDVITDTSRATAGLKAISTQVDKTAGSSGKLAGKFKENLKDVGKTVAGAFAADKIIDFTKESISAASDLNETMSKTGVVFGTSTKAVVDWSKNSSNAMGLSQQAALDAADTFGVFGQAAGLQGGKLGTFSTKLTQLAGDMASFSNTTPDQAVEAIGAALRGESEPIRQYGVLINDAAVKAEALKLHLVKASGSVLQIKRAQLSAESAQKAYTQAIKDHGAKSEEAKTALEKLKIAQLTLGKAVKGSVPQLTQQQKILATQRLIYDQTKNAQGDFARTSGGLANQQRILAAKIENVKAGLGKALLPLVLKAVTGFQKLTHWVAQNKSTLIPLATAIGAVVVAVKAVNAVTKAWAALSRAWTALTKAMAAAQWLLNAAMEANPIVLIIAALVALGVALFVAYKKFDGFRKLVDAVFHAVGAAVSAAVSFIREHWKLILAILTGPVGLAVAAILKYRDKIVGFFKDLPGKIKGFLSNLWNIIKAPFEKAWNWIQDHVGKPLKNFFRLFPQVVKMALANLWNTITAPFKKAWSWIQDHFVTPVKNFFTGLPGKVGDWLGNLASKITSPFQSAWNWISNHFISPIHDFFSGLPGKIGGWLSGLAGKITQPFKDAWNWISQHVLTPIKGIGTDIANAIKTPINWLIDKWNNLSFGIPGFTLPFPPHTHFGGIQIETPNIDHLATGGWVKAPTLAVVGEAGGEVVAPEPMLRQLIREELGQAGIHITVNGALDPDRVARQIKDLLEQRRRRVGGVARRGTALTMGATS